MESTFCVKTIRRTLKKAKTRVIQYQISYIHTAHLGNLKAHRGGRGEGIEDREGCDFEYWQVPSPEFNGNGVFLARIDYFKAHGGGKGRRICGEAMMLTVSPPEYIL